MTRDGLMSMIEAARAPGHFDAVRPALEHYCALLAEILTLHDRISRLTPGTRRRLMLVCQLGRIHVEAFQLFDLLGLGDRDRPPPRMQ